MTTKETVGWLKIMRANLKNFPEICNGETANAPKKIEALTNAIETEEKYQMMKADYENQLKNDLLAMVLEIQIEIDEIPRYRMTNNGICVYREMEEYMSDVNNVIKKVIDGLREESEEEDDYIC